MDALLAAISWFTGIIFDAAVTATSAVISAFQWPAQAMGVPPEILAAAVLCGLLLALWRAMGGLLS